MFGYVYLTTNLVNGKIYIGQHKVDSHNQDVNYLGSGKLILEAISKYGKENFKNDVLCWCNSEEELNEKEIFYIAEYKSTTDFGNYNISDGGFVPRFSGQRNGNYGKHRPHTEEEKRHLSNVLTGHSPTFCGHHTDEARASISRGTREFNLHRGKDSYVKVSQSLMGNKMMNKDGICKRVKPKDFEPYLQDGWKFGGLSRKGKYKDRHQLKHKNCTTLGRVAVNNGIRNTFVPNESLNEFLSNGWVLGLKKRVNQ